ncbi:MAG: hypothetical protein ABI728_13835, partial [Betaproteobacteria bacterium]
MDVKADYLESPRSKFLVKGVEQMKKVLVLLAVFAALACAQVTTSSTLDGTVTDAQGALVTGAQIL